MTKLKYDVLEGSQTMAPPTILAREIIAPTTPHGLIIEVEYVDVEPNVDAAIAHYVAMCFAQLGLPVTLHQSAA